MPRTQTTRKLSKFWKIHENVFQVSAKGKVFFEQHIDKRVKQCGFDDTRKQYRITEPNTVELISLRNDVK